MRRGRPLASWHAARGPRGKRGPTAFAWPIPWASGTPSRRTPCSSRFRLPLPALALGFHGHNDLGMATANTLAAVMAGAASVDVTVNGLGERAGNAPLEEVVMALRLTLKQNCGVDARRFAELSALVARASGRPLPADKPITGADVFRHESGIHVRGLLADRRTYEPFAPQTVGHADTEIVLGKHSGGAAIRQVLAEKGIRISDEEATCLAAGVRAAAAREKGGDFSTALPVDHRFITT